MNVVGWPKFQAYEYIHTYAFSHSNRHCDGALYRLGLKDSVL